MKIEFQATGTAEEVAQRVDEESKKASLAAADADEQCGAEGVFDAIAAVLTTVEGDRQATVTASAEVRSQELTKVYVDITIVPSGAVQEFKAAEAAKAADRPSASEFEAAVE